MPLLPKKVIAGLKPCTHGGLDHDELKALGIKPQDIIDFSVSTNPFMPPPEIRETLNKINFDRYPDSHATELRQKLSLRLGVPDEMILPGNGTTELIRLAALTYFRRNDMILILEPTYGEYKPACIIVGARILKYRAAEEANFSPNIEEVVRLIRRHHPRGVFVCNPNNPTGGYLGRKDMERILAAIDDGLLILDEAYASFVEKSWNSLKLAERDNVVILRSMTKDYGMPGIRLGYAVACRKIIDNLRPVLPPWNVNSIAQSVGTIVLDSDEYLRQSLVQVRKAKRFLNEEISNLGLKVLPSDAHYFLVKVGNGTKFRLALLKKGIQVRDCTSFGLAEYIRIAPRTMPENRKLITTIRSMRDEGKYTTSSANLKNI